LLVVDKASDWAITDRFRSASKRPHIRAELLWYEAHGVGKKNFKIKRYLD